MGCVTCTFVQDKRRGEMVVRSVPLVRMNGGGKGGAVCAFGRDERRGETVVRLSLVDRTGEGCLP